MKGRGLFNLFLLFGFVSYSTKLILARTNVLHEGVLDSLAYDPSLLSLLQMEQSLDLDDDEAAYLGTSLLDNKGSFLEQSSKHLGPGTPVRQSSFLQEEDNDVDDDSSFLEENLDDEDQDGSFLQEDDDDEEEDEGSLLESSSSSSSSASSNDVDDSDDMGAGSFLEMGSSYRKGFSPKTYGSMIQLHNFDNDPLNFLQDDTVLLVNDQDQEDFEADESPKVGNLKAYVLKGDSNDEVPELESLDETKLDKVVGLLNTYKFWLVSLFLLLLIAVVVRVYYLDKFVKFKNEFMAKLDNFNKAVVAKFNGVFKKNQTNTEEEETSPLLTA